MHCHDLLLQANLVGIILTVLLNAYSQVNPIPIAALKMQIICIQNAYFFLKCRPTVYSESKSTAIAEIIVRDFENS